MLLWGVPVDTFLIRTMDDDSLIGKEFGSVASKLGSPAFVGFKFDVH
jgi:hypothetical protein